jgi:hypothetical protein
MDGEPPPLTFAEHESYHSAMVSTPRRAGVALALVAAAIGISSCRDRTPPIVVEDRMVKVYNKTGTRLSDVRVWLNDHYMAATPALEPGGRLVVPQREFATAFGQKFNPGRQSPYGVLVLAKADSGEVKLVWGRPYRK